MNIFNLKRESVVSFIYIVTILTLWFRDFCSSHTTAESSTVVLRWLVFKIFDTHASPLFLALKFILLAHKHDYKTILANLGSTSPNPTPNCGTSLTHQTFLPKIRTAVATCPFPTTLLTAPQCSMPCTCASRPPISSQSFTCLARTGA